MQRRRSDRNGAIHGSIRMLTIENFLERVGGLAVLAQLSQQPCSFDELEDALAVSVNTLNERLGDATDLDLVTKEVDEEQEGQDVVYVLTSKGRNVCEELPEDLKEEFWNRQKDAATAVVKSSGAETESEEDVTF